ncbi:MAG: homocysteine S-methyltransferase family protein, partial [Gammaproteobacteria bacterium]|nr:homocysteine S-methyltransferase family protein [Gammaproteobacteria bacterium]
DVPVIISPTVETDGRLPDGSSLGGFIRRVDDESPTPPLYYMVNCAHPTHLGPTLEKAAAAGESWLERFRGFRANSSTRSHEELDNSTELDRGDPAQLARQMRELKQAYSLNIVGGCCGTDHRHITAIAEATAVRQPGT